MIVDDQRTKGRSANRDGSCASGHLMTVDDGVTSCDCFVLDVSPGGAKIITDVAIDVRDSFHLALVPGHTKRQSCEVVWRRGKTYGVKFLP